VGNEALAERGRLRPTHRYVTVPHQLRQVEPTITGAYLRAETQRAALAASAALPVGAAAAPVEPAAAVPATPSPAAPAADA
jgi:NAD(P)H-quinone oxidoreductase subunit K